MLKKIILKATKDAPEFYSQGNLDAEQKDGYFETTHRAFADSIIANGFGVEVETKDAAPKRAKKTATRKQKTEPAKKTAAAAPETETKIAESTEPAVEPNAEGESK